MKVEGVSEAVADMNAHTVTVTFDEARTGVEAIGTALHTAGFAVVGEPVKVESAPRPPGTAPAP